MTCLDCHTATLYIAAPGGEGKSEGKVSNLARTYRFQQSQPNPKVKLLQPCPPPLSPRPPPKKVFSVSDFNKMVENDEAEKVSLFH